MVLLKRGGGGLFFVFTGEAGLLGFGTMGKSSGENWGIIGPPVTSQPGCSFSLAGWPGGEFPHVSKTLQWIFSELLEGGGVGSHCSIWPTFWGIVGYNRYDIHRTPGPTQQSCVVIFGGPRSGDGKFQISVKQNGETRTKMKKQ